MRERAPGFNGRPTFSSGAHEGALRWHIAGTTLAERIGNVVQWSLSVPAILFVMDAGVALIRGYVLPQIVKLFVGAALCRATNYILTGR
jgi:hypothetical protein